MISRIAQIASGSSVDRFNVRNASLQAFQADLCFFREWLSLLHWLTAIELKKVVMTNHQANMNGQEWIESKTNCLMTCFVVWSNLHLNHAIVWIHSRLHMRGEQLVYYSLHYLTGLRLTYLLNPLNPDVRFTVLGKNSITWSWKIFLKIIIIIHTIATFGSRNLGAFLVSSDAHYIFSRVNHIWRAC